MVTLLLQYRNANNINDNIFRLKANDTTIVYNGAPVSATIQNTVLDSIENLPYLSINVIKIQAVLFNGCIQIYGTMNIADV